MCGRFILAIDDGAAWDSHGYRDKRVGCFDSNEQVDGRRLMVLRCIVCYHKTK